MNITEEPSDIFLYIILGGIAAFVVVMLLWNSATTVVSWFAEDESLPRYCDEHGCYDGYPPPYDYADVNRSNSSLNY